MSAFTTSVDRPVASTRRRRRILPRQARKSFALTFIFVVLLAAFLSPLLRSLAVSLQTPEQVGKSDAPIYPAVPGTYSYLGKSYDLYTVPIDGATRSLALVTKGRTESKFVDPASPEASPITWQGSWRTLDRAWVFSPEWKNYSDVWSLISFPRLLFNTIAIALIGMVGTLVSCVLVAYGFARFRFPGRNFLFTVLIATIFLPFAVTVIPTYAIFAKLGWVGTWLPLLVPTFFANAYDVFLLRQYLMTIPRDLDEAAAIDGAGPARHFWTIIFPLLSPTTFFLLVVNVVFAFFDTFAIVDTVTEGGPGQATQILVFKVYRDGFKGLDLGGSAAQSVVLMAIVITLTIVQFRYVERKVQY